MILVVIEHIYLLSVLFYKPYSLDISEYLLNSFGQSTHEILTAYFINRSDFAQRVNPPL